MTKLKSIKKHCLDKQKVRDKIDKYIFELNILSLEQKAINKSMKKLKIELGL